MLILAGVAGIFGVHRVWSWNLHGSLQGEISEPVPVTYWLEIPTLFFGADLLLLALHAQTFCGGSPLYALTRKDVHFEWSDKCF